MEAIAGDHVEVVHRIYLRQARSAQERTLETNRRFILDDTESHDPMAATASVLRSRRVVFPSAKLTTPLGRDNAWRGLIAPRLKTLQVEWATFQIMQRTHASLSRQAGIDPKLVAD
jgi:hypothetical protein